MRRRSVAQAQPVAELPVEVAEEVANVTEALTERIATLAVELNDKAVKAAERRVAEVLRTAGERRNGRRELADLPRPWMTLRPRWTKPRPRSRR